MTVLNLFIILSGYFLVKQQFKLKKLIKLLLQYSFYSIVILLIASSIHIIKLNYKTIFTALFPLTGFNWFADAYILLYIFFPFLNRLILCLKKNELQLFILMGAIIWYLIPTVASIFTIRMDMNFSNAIMFMYLYCIGAYIRIYPFSCNNLGGGQFFFTRFILFYRCFSSEWERVSLGLIIALCF